ncbi:MAG: hypothetical protein A2107_01745 [Verrucomicrobia bacterium GWF2_62_7]|nr:MAG: hypothetical protein A2107_01745 [Verrucomicrobia bacterium GWF2_62_7]
MMSLSLRYFFLSPQSTATVLAVVTACFWMSCAAIGSRSMSTTSNLMFLLRFSYSFIRFWRSLISRASLLDIGLKNMRTCTGLVSLRAISLVLSESL